MVSAGRPGFLPRPRAGHCRLIHAAVGSRRRQSASPQLREEAHLAFLHGCRDAKTLVVTSAWDSGPSATVAETAAVLHCEISPGEAP